MELDFIKQLIDPNDTKIVLLVMDGVGGLPMDAEGLTALEAAETPNLDKLAAQSICGLHQPVAAGITPGSGPGHLSLFGYDPLRYQVGRGVLSALGIGFDLTSRDVAARGNFCTLDDEGRVADRRAGRIPSEKNRELCELLRQIELPNVELFVETVKEYRLLLVLRGDGLSGQIADTDPQDVGEYPLDPKPLTSDAEETAQLVQQFLEQTREILADRHPANFVLLRGFANRPDWPSMEDAFGLRAAAIAAYPMYRGVAQLTGMEVLETGTEVEEEFDTLEANWDDFDFFFVHIKRIDSAGEDGDFDRKVALIEEADAMVPRLLDLGPDVILVTGDHSTPAKMKYHSWHPVPAMLWAETCRPDGVARFGERACVTGGLGPRLPATDLMPLALAHAGRLEKFGA
jgi:2,3-bisphosphoglycerate-independent phosphoglycerate mutase